MHPYFMYGKEKQRSMTEKLAKAARRTVNTHSDSARRKVDGRTEASTTTIAYSPAPERHSTWILQLLEKEV